MKQCTRIVIIIHYHFTSGCLTAKDHLLYPSIHPSVRPTEHPSVQTYLIWRPALISNVCIPRCFHSFLCFLHIIILFIDVSNHVELNMQWFGLLLHCPPLIRFVTLSHYASRPDAGRWCTHSRFFASLKFWVVWNFIYTFRRGDSVLITDFCLDKINFLIAFPKWPFVFLGRGGLLGRRSFIEMFSKIAINDASTSEFVVFVAPGMVNYLISVRIKSVKIIEDQNNWYWL